MDGWRISWTVKKINRRITEIKPDFTYDQAQMQRSSSIAGNAVIKKKKGKPKEGKNLKEKKRTERR